MAKSKRRTKGHKRSCGEKKGFESLEAAEKASKRGRYDYMEAYKCRKCNKFHFGHPKASTFSMGF